MEELREGASEEFKRDVIAIFSVRVSVSGNDEKATRALSYVSRQVSNAIAAEIATLRHVERLRATSYVWLDDPKANVFPCSECGILFTAQNLPDLVHGLPEGTKDEVHCHCLECLSWRKVHERGRSGAKGDS